MRQVVQHKVCRKMPLPEDTGRIDPERQILTEVDLKIISPLSLSLSSPL